MADASFAASVEKTNEKEVPQGTENSVSKLTFDELNEDDKRRIGDLVHAMSTFNKEKKLAEQDIDFISNQVIEIKEKLDQQTFTLSELTVAIDMKLASLNAKN